jgi:hypothetical protein
VRAAVKGDRVRTPDGTVGVVFMIREKVGVRIQSTPAHICFYFQNELEVIPSDEIGGAL